MVESVGKKLSQARQKRGLSVDAAAHATKLRPDKIAALEADDYSRFANNIYAKGFLQIYARYLNVDVNEFARTLDNANPISVGDYQYLSNAPAPRRERNTVRQEERRPPSLAPLLFFIALIGLAVVGSWVFTNYQRSQGERTSHNSKAEEIGLAPTPNPDAAFITATLAPVVAPAPVVSAPAAPKPAPVVAAVAHPASPAVATVTATPAPAAVSTPAIPAPLAGNPAPVPTPAPAAKNPEQDYVTPTPVASNDAHGAPADGVNEVLVATVKKTWITVRKDDPKAAPIFEDYVYPSANPLKLKGARFFIDAKDASSVQITKNGLPIAYQGPTVSVQ